MWGVSTHKSPWYKARGFLCLAPGLRAGRGENTRARLCPGVTKDPAKAGRMEAAISVHWSEQYERHDQRPVVA